MIEVNRKLFSRAVDLVAAAVPAGRYLPIPILGTVKVTAGETLRLEGTDLDNQTVVEIPCANSKGGENEFLLPQPRLVRNAVNQAGGEDVRLWPIAETGLRLRAGRLDIGFENAQGAEDFPTHKAIAFEDFSATFGADVLHQIRRVMSAISSEETRYYLQGICVKHVEGDTYRFASTNGHFLLVADIELPGAFGTLPERSPIIPHGWLKIVMSRFAKSKEEVRLTYGRTGLVGDVSGEAVPGGPRLVIGEMLNGIHYSVAGKLIDGEFPAYERIIPPSRKFTARILRRDLIQAVQSLAALRPKERCPVKLTFPAGKITCELYSADLGRSAFDIDAQHNVPQDVSHVGVNSTYLLSTLAAFQGEEIDFQLDDPSAPVLLTDPSDAAFKAVIMPTAV